MRVCIIGGGPAGIMAAISAKQKNQNIDVIILEKNKRLGTKLLITGKGRCNITNMCSKDELLENITTNKEFLYSSLNQFDNYDLLNFLQDNGLEVKVERGQRVFPKSDISNDVLLVLKKLIEKYSIDVRYNCDVKNIIIEEDSVRGVEFLQEGREEKIYCDRCILATGGTSYKDTGSTGDGYIIAKKAGHSITDINPGLVPLNIYEDYVKDLQGLSLKNVSIKIIDEYQDKPIYSDFGEMIFTHYGVSGPIILSASSILIKCKNLKEKLRNNNIKLSINLKPALSKNQLDNRIKNDFEKYINKEYKNALNDLLPKKIISIVQELSKINLDKKVNQITKEERDNIANILQDFRLTVKSFRPIDEAIVTIGGVNVKEINPKNMMSKIVNGLYFAGEIIDLDAYTGGFNLQIAFTTGYVAGKAIE